MAGVELFAAGVERILIKGARLHVHRWADYGGLDGRDLPVDHPFHVERRAYFAEMLGPAAGPAFYDFTLDFGPGQDAKLLDEADIARFGLATLVDDEDYAVDQALTTLSRKLDLG